MSAPTGRESDKFVLRLPEGMRDRIKAVADASGRSMNAEIVAALEEKFPATDPYADLIHHLEKARDLIEAIPEGPERDAARSAVMVVFIAGNEAGIGEPEGAAE